MLGQELISWTIRLSLACYAIVLAGGLLKRHEVCERNTKTQLLSSEFSLRWTWTAGCLLVWLHTVCVFQFYHHWSHASAVEHTARETAAVVGWDWCGGIWFNYLFLHTWTVDAAWWWMSPQTYRTRSLPIRFLLHGYLAFIIFNATVVFKTGGWRWVGTVVSIVLVLLATAALLHQSRRVASAAETGE